MINNNENIVKNTETKMKKCIEIFKNQIKKIHLGRISPNILNNIKIKYHENKAPVLLQYLASIVTENAHTLTITAFDPNITTTIEKHIIKSDLNLNTNSNGNIIRVYLPTLTEERREKLIKLIYSEGEKSKILIRNIRRITNNQIKSSKKNKVIDEEKERYLQNNIQNLTNVWIQKINEIIKSKKIELKNF